ncbi:ComEC/Rec2 family competence protein [Modestobacter sp. VKM Ac-2984]|nr:ComEC/Rec2 family competence protein [Modestobacter sp. VKM Ac-2984]MCZ2814984.1 ComEC/Rec2 family competence protein [Modestobacter sp. VKM Ac-2984]
MQTTDRWSWLDLRLVPPALTVWVLTLLAPHLPAGLLLALAAASALGAAGLLLAGRSHGARRQLAARGVVIGCLAAVTVTGATSAVRAQARAAAPLLAIADRGSVVEVLLELTDDPRPVAGAGAARVLVHGIASLPGDETGGGDPVLLFGAAEEWAGLLPGQSVRLHALVRPAEPGDDVVAVLSARSPPDPVGGPGAVQDVAGSLRTGLAESAARTLPDRAAGLLPGLVVGDTSAMDPALVEEFRRAGLAHLTAVSGANVAIVVGLVLWPLRARAVDRRWQALAAALAIAGFVVLARPGASVLRAAAMGAVAVLALASGRVRAAVPALAVTVLVLLLLSPGLAGDVGFALSVAATAAIVLLAPGWSRALRRHRAPRPVADAVAVSAAAGLATAPLVAGLAGLVSLVSLPANLLAAPAVPPATVLGVLAALVSPAAPWLADVLTWLAGWPVRWLVVVAERAAAVPDGTTGWPAGTRGAVLLAVLLAVVVWALWRWPRLRPLAVAALVGVVLVGWPLRQAGRGWPLPDTVVVACDVGQGDALVLPTGPDEAVLVDAGPDPVLVDGCLRRLGVDRLPLVLLSHLDADHVGGLAGALAGRDVGEVATGALTPDDERVPRLDRAVAEAGARHVVLRPGDRRTVGSAGFEVLAPDPAEAVAGAEPNDLSLVVRATQRGLRVLLTGDLGAGAEARLVAAGLDLGADVFKVPHHGSADADPGFLAASGAAVALISVGADNSYGHPTRRLLDWLADAGMRTYRTDRDGDVAVVGRAGEWGVAVRGPDAVLRAGADAQPPEAGTPKGSTSGARRAGAVATRSATRSCRRPVAAWARGNRSTSGTDLPAPGRGGRGGAAARPSRLRGARGGPRAPPRQRGARAPRSRPGGRPAGRRAGPLPVRWAPAGRRHRGAGVRGGAGRLPGELHQGARPGAHAGRRPLRREAERGAAEGVQGSRGGGRRVPEDQLCGGAGRLRAQRGAVRRRQDHPRCGDRVAGRGGQRPPRAVCGRQPARVGLRRGHRRRRRRPVPPRPGRGHRVHRRRAGAGRGHGRLGGDVAVGAGSRGGPRADRRCARRRGAHRRSGRLAEHDEHR